MNFLDWLIHVIHLTVIVINLTFWMSFRTLRIAQVTLALTLISWIGFGLVYGFGYCFLTDWHWQLKERAGEVDLPLSYVKLVIDRTFGTNLHPETVDFWTTVALIVSLVGCLIQSVRQWRRSTSG